MHQLYNAVGACVCEERNIIDFGMVGSVVNPFSPADQIRFCANSVDPDETAHNHPDIHCLPFCFDF